MEEALSIEGILGTNPELEKDVRMLVSRLSDETKRDTKENVLCYCASTPELYRKFCDYLTKKVGISSEAIRQVSFTQYNLKGALEQYLLDNIVTIEETQGDIVFIQVRGFVDMLDGNVNDNYADIIRFGHDYDQHATEDFHRNLGREQSKPIFVLTHIDKNHPAYEKAIITAASSHFKFLLFEI